VAALPMFPQPIGIGREPLRKQRFAVFDVLDGAGCLL
jgi:hypothetical protein